MTNSQKTRLTWFLCTTVVWMTLLGVALLTSCATITDKLKKTIADLDLKGQAREQACELYIQRGRGLAEDAWANDWPVFQPLFASVPDPAAGETFCRQVITDRGAQIFTKPPGSFGSAQALKYAVALPADFESRGQPYQAALMCHEASHIVWQHRVSTILAIADYATISGRLTVEGTAYALQDALLAHYGVAANRLAKLQRRREAAFPEKYKLSRTVEPACVSKFFGAIREALHERGGV